MRLRERVDQLERLAANVIPPGRLDLVVCHPEGTDPDGRPAGQYPNPTGNVMDYIYAGPDPDPTILAKLQTRMTSTGMVIVSDPETGS